MPDHTAICFDIRRFPLATKQLPQCDRDVVGGSDEEQGGYDQPPDLFGVRSIVMVRESLVLLGSDHPWELEDTYLAGGQTRIQRVVYIHLSIP